MLCPLLPYDDVNTEHTKQKHYDKSTPHEYGDQPCVEILSGEKALLALVIFFQRPGIIHRKPSWDISEEQV